MHVYGVSGIHHGRGRDRDRDRAGGDPLRLLLRSNSWLSKMFPDSDFVVYEPKPIFSLRATQLKTFP